MLKTLLKALGLLTYLVWINLTNAATMGGINVTSALGYPLKAEISLTEMSTVDKAAFAAKMASVNEFKSAGIDYPYSLPKLNFEVSTRANGDAYLKLTSTQPVNEPFVSILIELSWPSGKLLREYTFLLDPAGFIPDQPKLAEVKPVEPMVPVVEPEPIVVPVAVPEAIAMPDLPEPKPYVAVVDTKEAVAEAKTVPAPMESGMVAAELTPAEPVQAEADADKLARAEPVTMEPLVPVAKAPVSIMIEKGDTLGKVADAIKPVDVSLERMLVAMYRANAKTFDGQNMNRIKAGKILRMPGTEEIAKVTQAAAVKEIRAQVADWQDYRQKLAATQVMPEEQAHKQEAAGKISAAVAEKAPAVKESAKEVLRLSKGAALGDKAVASSDAMTEQEKLTTKADEAAAKNKQMQEEQKKIAKLEEINKDASKLVELKGLPAAAPEVKTPAPVKGLPVVPATQPQPVSDEFDLMAMFDKYWAILWEDPIILGGGIAVLLGLVGLGFVIARRATGGQKKSKNKNVEVGAATGSWRTPVTPSPDTGDFTQSSVPAVAPMPNAAQLDDVDPISEAELFLNFGRDTQAEEILKDALSKNSSNMQVKLKLLSIYANRKDSKLFSKYAQEIKDSGDTAAWERAAVMGAEMDPANPAYGDAKGEVRHREAAPAEVDFDLGFGKSEASAKDQAAAGKDMKMDFDVTAAQSDEFASPFEKSDTIAKPAPVAKLKSSADVDATSILSRDVVQAAETSHSVSPMDFDVSGILPGDVKSIANSTSMDFDISGIPTEKVKETKSSSTMDFDLTGDIPDMAPAVVAAPVTSTDLNFDDLVFEIPTNETKPVQVKVKAVSVEESMEFTVDFPAASDVATPAKKLDIDFGDINISLDDEAPAARAGGEGKDEQWHEVATKLDLAKAYQEMGDADGAREILEEVIRDGDEQQREAAEKLMQQIAA